LALQTPPAPTTAPTTGRGDSPADVRLLRRFAATRAHADRERLVHRYLPLARFAASRYTRRPEAFDDLLQVACVGLMKAIDRFDPSSGVPFTSYAMPTMLGELRRHFRDHGWAVRPPRGLLEHALLVGRETDALTERLGRSPSVPELADATGLTTEEVLDAREAAVAQAATSLSAPVGGTDGESLELGDRLGVEDDGYDRAEDRITIDGLMQRLSRRDREIVRLRMMDDLTQSEIGRQVGLSQMHVSRILRDALRELHAAAADAGAIR
jgi:RNA polymerase sigma-B factor